MPSDNLKRVSPHQDFMSKDEVSTYIEGLFEEVNGFDTESGAAEKWGDDELVALTYGELKTESFEKVFEALELTEKDRFVDLGSGVGKLNIQMFMRTPIQSSIGVEISKRRFDFSKNLLQQFKQEHPEYFNSDREIKFLNKNFLDVDLSQTSIVFMCATCYSDELMNAIAEKLNNSPSMRYAISLREIHKLDFPLKTKFEFHTSWSDSSPCHIYERK